MNKTNPTAKCGDDIEINFRVLRNISYAVSELTRREIILNPNQILLNQHFPIDLEPSRIPIGGYNQNFVWINKFPKIFLSVRNLLSKLF